MIELCAIVFSCSVFEEHSIVPLNKFACSLDQYIHYRVGLHQWALVKVH